MTTQAAACFHIRPRSFRVVLRSQSTLCGPPGMLSQVSTGALPASLPSRVCLSTQNHSRLVLRSSPSARRGLSCRRGILAHATTRESQRQRPGQSPCRSDLRRYATAAEAGVQLPKDIAILGGGLTALTTAYYLTRFHPSANVTIYEAADRVGGWIDTERVDVKTQKGEHATVSFERGARTVAPQSSLGRWEDFVLFDLVRWLLSPPYEHCTSC